MKALIFICWVCMVPLYAQKKPNFPILNFQPYAQICLNFDSLPALRLDTKVQETFFGLASSNYFWRSYESFLVAANERFIFVVRNAKQPNPSIFKYDKISQKLVKRWELNSPVQALSASEEALWAYLGKPDKNSVMLPSPLKNQFRSVYPLRESSLWACNLNTDTSFICPLLPTDSPAYQPIFVQYKQKIYLKELLVNRDSQITILTLGAPPAAAPKSVFSKLWNLAPRPERLGQLPEISFFEYENSEQIGFWGYAQNNFWLRIGDTSWKYPQTFFASLPKDTADFYTKNNFVLQKISSDSFWIAKGSSSPFIFNHNNTPKAYAWIGKHPLHLPCPRLAPVSEKYLADFSYFFPAAYWFNQKEALIPYIRAHKMYLFWVRFEPEHLR